MYRLFAFLSGLAVLTAFGAVHSAKAFDARPFFDPHPEAARAPDEATGDGYATSFPCLLSCVPGGSGYVDGAHMSLDPGDARQMDILFSGLVGVLVMPPAAADVGARQAQTPGGDPASPVDAITASRAALSAPTAELKR